MTLSRNIKILNINTLESEGVALKYDMTIPTYLYLFKNGSDKIKFNGVDLYDCFTKLRELLEIEGKILMCNGSRFDTHSSGGLRDMSNGSKTYLLELGIPPSKILDVFEFSEINLGTTEVQRKFYEDWKRSLRG